MSTTSFKYSSVFKDLPNVLLTPAIAEDTSEALIRQADEVAQSIIRYFNDGSTVGSVNFPSVAAWPLRPGCRRIVNMHRNVRGVLKEIDYILSAYNVGKQVLETKDGLGYAFANGNQS